MKSGKLNIPELSRLGMRGNREAFQRYADEGFTEFSVGLGDWVEVPGSGWTEKGAFGYVVRVENDQQVILCMMALYHPSGRIKLFDYTKVVTHLGYRKGEYTHVQEFPDQDKFDDFLKSMDANVGERKDIMEALKQD